MIEAYADPQTIFLAALAGLIAAVAVLLARSLIHRRHRAAIPVRIHVAGSRGKSSTVRLIVAGLRAGGHRVAAKTTGTVPRLIGPDGSERRWRRWGPATIGEQARFFAYAAKQRAEIVVLECMAIRPELVAASEDYFVRATLAVVTNTRADHLEELSQVPGGMAESLLPVVPQAGRLIVTDEVPEAPFRDGAAARGTTITTVATTGLAPVEAHRRIAVTVCELLGVERAVAAVGMEQAAPDPGAFGVHDIELGALQARFFNAFACNDIESLAELWRRHAPAVTTAVLLNARRDRPQRSRAFLMHLARLDPPIRLFIAGGGPFVGRMARSCGFAPRSVERLDGLSAAAALTKLAAAAGPDGAIWGVGNYRGLGAAILDEIGARATSCSR